MTVIRSLEQTLLDNPVVSLCAIWHKGESLPYPYTSYRIYFSYILQRSGEHPDCG